MRIAVLSLLLIGVTFAAVRSAAAQPAAPTCSAFSQEAAEGDAGTTSMAFLVSCDNPTGLTDSIEFATGDETAGDPEDYFGTTGDLDVPPGSSNQHILVEVVGDADPEPDETFSVVLWDPDGSGLVFGQAAAVGTIRDDDVTGPTCSVSDRSVTEGIADLTFHVVCINPTPLTERISYATSDETATASVDYSEASGELDVPPGLTDREVLVDVIDDPDPEQDETLLVSLSDPHGSVVFGQEQATGTIRDNDDGAGGAPCIMLSDTAVSVGGRASTPTTRRFAGPVRRLTMSNCGGSSVAIDVRGTDATGPGATWELTNASSGGPVDSTCDLGTDVFRAHVTVWLSTGGGVGTGLTTSPTPLLGEDGTTPFTLAPAAEQEISPDVELPCAGSSGLGRRMTMEVTLTAIAAP